MKDSRFGRRGRFIFFMVMIALASIGVRILMGYDFHHTALLYIGAPFVISLVLILLRPVGEVGWKMHFVKRIMDAFIIMLGSSVVLFEGFICVAMFILIYLFVILVMFVSEWFYQRSLRRGRSTLRTHALPLLLLFSAFEGVTPQWSFDRNEQVSVSRVVPASIAQITRNLQQPMDLQTSRPWFLHLFPMPYDIRANSLQPGDIHEVYFRYRRWFVSDVNVHEGSMLLEISEVDDKHIRTTFLQDTSYFKNYLRLRGTEILFDEITPHKTLVTLRIDYERTLDPYWYFAPICRYGVRKTAEFLIKEVISNDQA